METLDYTSLYNIIKYQYDKVKLKRESMMSDEEKNRRKQLDNLVDIYNNPNYKNLSSMVGEMIQPKEPEKDDPNTYVYNSKNYI
jgi:hypothetical protein